MSSHIGMRAAAYVDGMLDGRTIREIDRHLVACQVCVHTIDQERKLLSSLRYGSTPQMTGDLRASLMSLGAGPMPERGAPAAPRLLGADEACGDRSWADEDAARGLAAAAAPSLARPRPAPVPTVSPSQPALHRSPRRAAGLAGFAASASAVAAIGLAVAGPGATASPARLPSGRLGGTVPVSTETVSLDSSGQLAGSRLGTARVALGTSSAAETVSPARPGTVAQGATFWTRTTTRR